MRSKIVAIALLLTALPLWGQSTVQNTSSELTDSAGTSSLPVVVKFNGNMQEFGGGSISTGYRGMTFGLYKDRDGGVPLWMETQTVSIDTSGNFAVMLGVTTTTGVPASVFASVDPRWISVTLDDGAERPRVQLSSVPYAFKAANADTLGGKSSEQFVTQQQLISLLGVSRWPNPIPGSPVPIGTSGVASSFEATAIAGPSFVSDATSGPPLQVKSGTLVPNLNVDMLHGLTDTAFANLTANNSFLGVQNFLGGINMPANNLEPNTSNTFDSAPLDFGSSSLGQGATTSTTHRFRWTSQPLPPANTGPIARLSMSFGINGANPSPTGLSINSDGTINFAPGQQLPPGAVLGALSNNPGNQGAGVLGGNPFVDTGNFKWEENPTNPVGVQVGLNTVYLAPCPRGLNGTDLWHYVYISGTGTPEVVLITGGSCTSQAKSGTVEFTAAYEHPLGYLIGSASDGIQEAIIVADVAKSAGALSRQVIITPGSHLLRARVSVRSSTMTITSSGASLTCSMSDTCLMLGDPSNENEFNGITLQGLRLGPGVKGGTWPAVEDNAQGSQITDFAPGPSAVLGASFGSLVQVDNDQGGRISDISSVTNLLWGRCDTSFCSTAIVGPGPYSKNAGVLTVEHPNLSLQCGGNGIDNQDGNTLLVTGGVIQGYAQFGVRSSTVYRLSTVTMTGVYQEEDSNCNPLGTGSTGLIVEDGASYVTGGAPAGLLPQFANTGSTQFNYYVVVHSSTWGTSPEYLAGTANTDGSGSINVLWNQVGKTGTITYDVLRITVNVNAPTAAPFGTGQFAIATGVPASLCSNNVCSVSDNAGSSPSSYTVASDTPYWPALRLWPGPVILTSASDRQNTGGGNPTMYFTDQLPRGSIVNSGGATYPSVFAQECNPQSNWSPISMQCIGGNSVGNDYPSVVGTLMQLSGTGGAPGGLKGRLNFLLPPGAEVGPTHVITLSDSNPDKTLATPGNRPANDPNDSYIGYDGGWFPSTMQIAFGAPVSLSRYIGNAGDGLSYLERLTATQEQYRVPVSLDSMLFSNLAALLPTLPSGSIAYCSDCGNVADDGATFDSNVVGNGHGTNVVLENGHWRVH